MNYYTKTILDDLKSFYGSFSIIGPKSIVCAKASLSACIAYLISLALELGSNYWAPFCCFIMITPYLGTGIEKGLHRITGTIIGAFVAFIVFGFTIQNQLFYTVFLLIIATFCYYMQAVSKHMGYFWFMIVLAFTLISSIGFENALSPAQFMLAAFNRVANLSIGISVYLLINYLFKPRLASDELATKVKLLKKELASFINDIYTQYINLSYSVIETDKKHETLIKLIRELENLLYNAQIEKQKASNLTSDIELKRAEDLTNSLITFYQSISNASSATYQTNYKAQILKIIETFMKVSHYQAGENVNSDSKYIEMQLNIITLKYDKSVRKGRHFTYSTIDTYIFQESLILLKEYLTFFILKKNLYNESSTPLATIDSAAFDEFLGYSQFSVFGYKIFIHKPYLLFAFRTAITLAVVIWAWKFLDLPSDMGAANVSVAVMTASIPDYVSSRLKGILRFLGCAAGFLIGCFLLFFNIDSTAVMLICVFSVGYLSALIMQSCPRISYLGLQAFLAFCVAFIPGWGPVDSLEKVLLRFISIFFGITVMWLMSLLFWKSNYFFVVKNGILLFCRRLSFFRISHPSDYSPCSLTDGINILKFNIDKLTLTTPVSSADQAVLKKWCDASIRLLITSRNLIASSEESKKFIAEIEPEPLYRIDNLFVNFFFPENPESVYLLNQEITDIMTSMEHIKHTIRSRGLLRPKNMPFKQETMRCIILIKRLMARFKDINSLHPELILIFKKEYGS